MSFSHSIARALLTGAMLAAILVSGAAPSHADPETDAATEPVGAPAGADWVWPLARFRLERAFEAPAHRYAPGHRGIDLRADPHEPVRAPAAGTIAFSGAVAGRGILTIDHGDGLVTTLEPIESELAAGVRVEQGEEVAALALGGHSPPGALHFGVRLDGEYVNPMLMLGGVPRAVLLPCC